MNPSPSPTPSPTPTPTPQPTPSPDQVDFLHVKGHSNHVWNDLADTLANRGATGARSSGAGLLVPNGAPPPPQQPTALAAATAAAAAAVKARLLNSREIARLAMSFWKSATCTLVLAVAQSATQPVLEG